MDGRSNDRFSRRQEETGRGRVRREEPSYDFTRPESSQGSVSGTGDRAGYSSTSSSQPRERSQTRHEAVTPWYNDAGRPLMQGSSVTDQVRQTYLSDPRSSSREDYGSSGYMRLQDPRGHIHILPLGFSSTATREREQWQASYQGDDHLSVEDRMLMFDGTCERSNNGWINLDRRATRIHNIKDKLQTQYSLTKESQEKRIMYLAHEITRNAPHLAGEVIKIRTRYGQAYQQEKNRLDVAVMRQEMDGATRDEQEITLRAQLYVDQVIELEEKAKELSS